MKIVLVRSRAIDPGPMKIAASLGANGHSVTLLVWNRARTRENALPKGYSIAGFGLAAPYDDVSTLILLPIWWLAEFLFLLKTDAEVVHACDLDTLVPAIIAKQIKRIKLYYTIYDFYAANLPSQTPTILRRLVALVERRGAGHADVLFLPDEIRYAQVKGAKVRKIVYLYNSPPDYHSSYTAVQTPHSPNLVLLYAGILHPSRGIEQLIHAAADLNGVQLVVAGTGPEREFVADAARTFPSRIRYIGQVPYHRIIEETERADALVAFYDPALPNTPYASPNKLFEAMMSGKPIVTNSECGASRIVNQEDCGVTIPFGDTNRIKEAIVSLRDHPDWRRRLGANARKAYEREYGWAIMEKRLLEAYSGL